MTCSSLTNNERGVRADLNVNESQSQVQLFPPVTIIYFCSTLFKALHVLSTFVHRLFCLKLPTGIFTFSPTLFHLFWEPAATHRDPAKFTIFCMCYFYSWPLQDTRIHLHAAITLRFALSSIWVGPYTSFLFEVDPKCATTYIHDSTDPDSKLQNHPKSAVSLCMSPSSDLFVNWSTTSNRDRRVTSHRLLKISREK